MINRQYIGHVMPSFEVLVEKGRLRFFAKATGQTDPVYSDEAAARAAGHPAWGTPTDGRGGSGRHQHDAAQRRGHAAGR